MSSVFSGLALEDEGAFNLAPVCREPAEAGTLEHLSRTTLFFQPVEGNMAHHSLMGERPFRFDFLCQPIKLVDAEYHQDRSPAAVTTLVSRCPPSTCTLSSIEFGQLSKSLRVWYDSDSGYRVNADFPDPAKLVNLVVAKFT